MKGKIVPAVFLMLVLLIGFPSSAANFTVFADDDDNDNLQVSAEKFEDAMEDAQEAIDDAEEEIARAEAKIFESDEKEIDTDLSKEYLDLAKEKLSSAITFFEQDNFEEAEELAEEAEDLAKESRMKLIGKTQSDLHEDFDEIKEDYHGGDDDRLKLEAELEHPSTGEDGGKAKYEKRSDDREKFSVEIEDQMPEATFDVVFSDLTIATITTDSLGFADFNLDTKDDDTVPSVSVGDLIQIFKGSVVVLEGIFSSDDDHEDSDKVTLCHIRGNSGKTKTITVNVHALNAHLAHGDYEGECEHDHESSLAKIEAKLAKKYAKLEEKRYKFAMKQMELAEKYAEKFAKLESKYAEKEAKLTDKYNLKLERLAEELDERQEKYLKKSAELQQKLNEKIDKLDSRAQKLVENFNSGEYFGEEVDVVEDDTIEYVLKFDSLTGESFIDSSTSTEFFAEITLESSSSGSDDNLKFKVTGCSIIGEGDSYSCAFGKARTVSSGTSGDEEKLTIMAFLEDDDSESTSSLKVFVTPVDSSFASLEDGAIDVTMKGSITLQWSFSGDGTLSVIDNSEANP